MKTQDVLIEIANQTGWHTKTDIRWTSWGGDRIYVELYDDFNFYEEFCVENSIITLIAVGRTRAAYQSFDLHDPDSIEKLTSHFNSQRGNED